MEKKVNLKKEFKRRGGIIINGVTPYKFVNGVLMVNHLRTRSEEGWWGVLLELQG